MNPFWLIAGIALAALAAGRMLIGRRRRRRALGGLAARNALSYSPDDPIGLPQRYHSLQLIRQGHSRCAADVVHGATPAGLLSLFSYTFDEGFAIRRIARRWWMAVLELNGPPQLSQFEKESIERDGSARGMRIEIRGRLAAVAMPAEATPAAPDEVLMAAQAVGQSLLGRPLTNSVDH